jgi:hypothetical protein
VIPVEGTGKIHLEPGQDSMVDSPVLLILLPTRVLDLLMMSTVLLETCREVK